VYSFGITLWEVITRKKPFYHLGNVEAVTIQIKAIQGEKEV